MIRRKCSVVIISLFNFLFLLPTSDVSADSPWRMFLHDARHTGRSSYVIGQKVSVLWNSNCDKSAGTRGATGLVVGSDETIYVGDVDHYLYALNARTGSVKWKFLTKHEVVGSPALDAYGNIYVGSKDGYIYCLKPGGKLKWKFGVGPVTSSPAISDSNVVLVPTLGRLYAFSLQGKSLWKEAGKDGIPYGSQSTPAIGPDGTVYSINLSNGLYAFNPDGILKWNLSIPEANFSSPTVGDNGIIYCAGGHMAMGGDYALYAIRPNGTLKWTYTLQDMPYLSSPATGPGKTIYIACNDYYLYAINPNGTLKWRFLFGGSMNGTAVAIDKKGTILAADGGSRLYAINPYGKLKWKIDAFKLTAQTGNAVGWMIRAPVISTNGRIYMGHEDGVLALATESVSGDTCAISGDVETASEVEIQSN
jgi:outer membrane protein assembly factor BamB